MAALYVRIPDTLKARLDARAEKGKQVWPPMSLADVVRAALETGLNAMDERELAALKKQPRKRVRRG